ncbi:MAG: hypothetical protein AAF191_17890 [Verrucomicrobiota bacterium]
MKHKVGWGKITLIVTLGMTAIAWGGPTGEPNEAFEDFLRRLLTGRRIDSLWDPEMDRVRSPALDERLEVTEAFLSEHGAPLTTLREDLALGMTRSDYEFAASLALEQVMQELPLWDHPPAVYRGEVGSGLGKFAMRFFETGEVIGLYYLTHGIAEVDVARYWSVLGATQDLEREQRLILERYTGKVETGRFYLTRQPLGAYFHWKGNLLGTDGRRDPVTLRPAQAIRATPF